MSLFLLSEGNKMGNPAGSSFPLELSPQSLRMGTLPFSCPRPPEQPLGCHSSTSTRQRQLHFLSLASPHLLN